MLSFKVCFSFELPIFSLLGVARRLRKRQNLTSKVVALMKKMKRIREATMDSNTSQGAERETVQRDKGAIQRDEGAVQRDEGVVQRDEGTVQREKGSIQRDKGEKDEGAAQRDKGAVQRDNGAVQRDEGPGRAGTIHLNLSTLRIKEIRHQNITAMLRLHLQLRRDRHHHHQVENGKSHLQENDPNHRKREKEEERGSAHRLLPNLP